MKSQLTPNSSNIKRIAHDGTHLFVEMAGGSYRYLNVPESHYDAMVLAESAGKYLNSEIKGKFDFEKLESIPAPAPAPAPNWNGSIAGSAPAATVEAVPARNEVKIVGPALMQGSALSAGYDLITTMSFTLHDGEHYTVPTGVKLAMPPNMCAWVTPRSGLASKRGVTVLNAPGLIDPDYTGEIGVVLINLSGQPQVFDAGDRIAQLVFAPFFRPTFVQVDTLETTARGDGGFGSSGTATVPA